MRTGLFDNTKNALVFGGCVLVAAVMLIGEEGEDSAVAVTSGPASQEPSYRPPSARRMVRSEQPEIGDLSDFYGSADDSIDEAEGSDPTPTSVPSGSDNIDAGPSTVIQGKPRPGIDGPGT